MNDTPDFIEMTIDQGIADHMDHARIEAMEAFSADKFGFAKTVRKHFDTLDLDDNDGLTFEELRTVANDKSQPLEIRATASLLDANFDSLRGMSLEIGTAGTLPTNASQRVFDEYFNGDPKAIGYLSRADVEVFSDLVDRKGSFLPLLTAHTRDDEILDLMDEIARESVDGDQQALGDKFQREFYTSGVPEIVEAIRTRQEALDSWVVPKLFIE